MLYDPSPCGEVPQEAWVASLVYSMSVLYTVANEITLRNRYGRSRDRNKGIVQCKKCVGDESSSRHGHIRLISRRIPASMLYSVWFALVNAGSGTLETNASLTITRNDGPKRP